MEYTIINELVGSVVGNEHLLSQNMKNCWDS